MTPGYCAGDRNKGLAKDKVDGPGSTGAAPADDSEKEGERETTRRRRKAVLYSGIITAVGISMHNFPEGIAVFLGSMKVHRRCTTGSSTVTEGCTVTWSKTVKEC